MPKPKGEVQCDGQGGHKTRVRVMPQMPRVRFALPTCSTCLDCGDVPEADERSRLVAEFAKRIRHVPRDYDAKVRMLKEVANASIAEPPSALRLVEDFIGGKLPALVPKSASPTFKGVGEGWTSNRLADRYPNQIREKRSVSDDISRFTNYTYPIIGDTPIRSAHSRPM